MATMATLAADPVSAMSLHWVDTGQVIFLEASGVIEPADLPQVAKALASNAPEYLVLDSPGGDVRTSLSIGRLVRAYGVDTYVPEGGVCYSACVFLFSSGVERLVSTAGKVGVHQFYGGHAGARAEVVQAETQRLSGTILAFLLEMGVSALVSVVASDTPPDDIHVFSPEELEAYGLSLVARCPTGDEFGAHDPMGLFPCTRARMVDVWRKSE